MGTHLLFCSSLLLILRDGRLGFCLIFTSPHLILGASHSSEQKFAGSIKEILQLLQLLCSYLLRESTSSHPAASPVPRHLHSCTAPGQINFFVCCSQQTFCYVLSAWCFSRVPSQKGRSCLEALEAGSRGAPAGEQPQVVTGIQSAVSIRKWQAQRPQNFLPPWRNRYRLFLLTSCTVNVSGDRIHTFGIHTSCIATQDKVTSLQHLQLSNRILTLTGFLAEKHCVFQLAVTKKSSLLCSVILMVVLCISTNWGEETPTIPALLFYICTSIHRTSINTNFPHTETSCWILWH